MFPRYASIASSEYRCTKCVIFFNYYLNRHLKQQQQKNINVLLILLQCFFDLVMLALAPMCVDVTIVKPTCNKRIGQIYSLLTSIYCLFFLFITKPHSQTESETGKQFYTLPSNRFAYHPN